MSLSFISSASDIGPSGSGTTIAIGTHATGDLILIFAAREGNATPPSLPAGWTNIQTGGNAAESFRLAYKIAASGSETSGTWTNATGLIAVVYRGYLDSGPIGSIGTAQTGGGTTITYPGLTLAVTDGTSWAVRFASHGWGSGTLDAPSGMTNRISGEGFVNIAAHDSNGGVSSLSSATANITGGGWDNWVATSIEIKAGTSGGEITGTASITLAAQSLASAGAVAIAGASAPTQAGQSLASAGAIAVVGASALTQANQSLSLAGVAPIVGAAAITQASNSVASAGTAPIVGASSSTQTAQSVSSAGTVAIAGASTRTQADQTSTAAGTVFVVGALSSTQEAQSLASAGGTGTLGTAAITQADQSAGAAGAVTIVGASSTTQSAQSLASAGTVAVLGSLAADQADNTLASEGVGIALTVGSLASTQDSQSASGAGKVAIAGASAIGQANQGLNAAGSSTVSGSASISQASSTLLASGYIGLGVITHTTTVAVAAEDRLFVMREEQRGLSVESEIRQFEVT